MAGDHALKVGTAVQALSAHGPLLHAGASFGWEALELSCSYQLHQPHLEQLVCKRSEPAGGLEQGLCSTCRLLLAGLLELHPVSVIFLCCLDQLSLQR